MKKRNPIGKRLRLARLMRGLTQVQLAEMVGIKQQTIMRIEQLRHDSTPLVVELAIALGVDAYWLATGKERFTITLSKGHSQWIIQENKNLPMMVPYIPLITWEEAGKIRRACDVKDFAKREKFPLLGRAGGNSFALEFQGVSMFGQQPKDYNFSDGDILIFDPDFKPKHSDFVLTRLPDQSAACLRQLTHETDGYYLRPLNTQFQAQKIMDFSCIFAILAFRCTFFDQADE
jgi:SOS-response transcriptional repressor LexA